MKNVFRFSSAWSSRSDVLDEDATSRYRERMDQLVSAYHETRDRQALAESNLWDILCRFSKNQRYGVKFLRRHVINPYIADFACLNLRIIIDLDGGYGDCHCEDDLSRQQYFERRRWFHLGFSNNEVLDHPVSVAKSIRRMIAFRNESSYPRIGFNATRFAPNLPFGAVSTWRRRNASSDTQATRPES